MLTPSPDELQVVREFTDREQPMKNLQDALTEPQAPDEYRVHVLRGPGGQGKTALREQFCRRISSTRTAKRVVLSVLDFGEPRSRQVGDATLQLRLGLGIDGLIEFPTFDTTFTHLFSLEHPGEDIRGKHPALFRKAENETLADLLLLAEDVVPKLIPGTSLLYKYGHRLVGRFRERWEKRELQPHVAEIERLSPTKLREKLPIYLGRDLCRAMQAADGPRVVLILDSYEALWSDAPRGAMQTMRTDDWVRTLIRNAPGALVLIFSRETLPWAAQEPAWGPILGLQKSLDGLARGHALRYLEHCRISPAAIRDRIVQAAEGVPFYLERAVDQFEAIAARGREPVAADFAATQEEVLDRFLEHVSEGEVADLKLASYPEVIDEELFRRLCEQFLGGSARGDWRRLVHRSHVSQSEQGRARLHGLMRKGLQDREESERPRLFREIHRFLFEHYDAEAHSAESARVIDDAHDSALLAAARHLAAADPKRLVPWILEPRWQKYYHAGRWRALANTLEKVSELAAESSAQIDARDAVWLDHQRGHVYQVMDRMVEAKQLFEQARQKYIAAGLSERDPDYATILHALADVVRDTGEIREAEQLYGKAMRIYEASPSAHPARHAHLLYSVARLLDADGRDGEADEYYETAKATYASVDIDSNGRRQFADFLLWFARARQRRGRDAEAEALFEEALAVYIDSVGDTHPGYATALLDLSLLLAQRGNCNRAEATMAKAVSIHAAAFGPEHPCTGRALHLQGAVLLRRGESGVDVRPQIQRAFEILQNSLSDTHEWTREAGEDLRRLDLAESMLHERDGSSIRGRV